ncbi:hypothetical protein AB0I60_19135 [Actinosynnema sp. NPDC050436]|uniref:hypothetical protein n=1 Tax=Actinosynnema sp. NPDC050436 TaxID=3155659 RepID=UPI0033D848F0
MATVALSTAAAATAVATVSLPAASAAEVSAAVTCQTGIDSRGPGGAGRGHTWCTGKRVYVQTTVYCDNGSSSKSAWLWEYSKAECQYGIKAYKVSYATRT